MGQLLTSYIPVCFPLETTLSNPTLTQVFAV